MAVTEGTFPLSTPIHQYCTVCIASCLAHDNSLTTYDVQYQGLQSSNDVNETFFEAVTVSAGMQLSYNISGLMAYSAYNVSVRATNQFGVGEFSEEVTVRTEEGGESALHCMRGICSDESLIVELLSDVRNLIMLVNSS